MNQLIQVDEALIKFAEQNAMDEANMKTENQTERYLASEPEICDANKQECK